MKNILFLLAFLISGLVNSQIVQPRSTTTFSNVRATGSMTVANKLRVGSTTAPSATLDVTGTFSLSNQSFSVGTTALTGGNTGTIAVLSDVVFPVNCIASPSNLTDGATYYFGAAPRPWMTSRNGQIFIPYNATLIGASCDFFVNGSVSAAETSTLILEVGGVSTLTLSSSITFSSSSNNYTITGLSTNVNANSLVNCKMLNPTWATDPTSVSAGIVLWFVRRQ